MYLSMSCRSLLLAAHKLKPDSSITSKLPQYLVCERLQDHRLDFILHYFPLYFDDKLPV